jgi:hypothetical protein
MKIIKKLEYVPIKTFLVVKKFVSRFFKKVRTAHIEMGFVGIILALVAIITRRGFVEWLGVAAVFLNFGYITIADRLREAEQARAEKLEPVTVECYWKLDYYYMLKEIFWLMYFAILGAYSAIIGIFLFLAYRPWRSYYRKYSKIIENK